VVQDSLVSREPRERIERFYREEGARVWRALFAFAGDRDVASDALAEALAQALGRGDAVNSPGRWVWRAAFRIAAGELKQRRRHGPLGGADLAYEMEDPPADLLQALVMLSPKQRAATILHFYVGYPTREVAEILNCSTATVRVHLSQGRKRLRTALEKDDD
jgi:RNA polymerase sigma factor (sigma-70 family)